MAFQVQLFSLRGGERYLNISAKSHQELFSDPLKYVSQIPPEERYNIFYTAGYADAKAPRKFRRQDIIPFDIDGIDLARIDQYVDVILKELELDKNKTVVVASGNGLQIIVLTEDEAKFKDEKEQSDYFKKLRPFYKYHAKKIARALKLAGLPQEEKGTKDATDTNVWSPNRFLRLPGTQNRKVDKATGNTVVREARLLQSRLEPQPFKLAIEGYEPPNHTEQINPHTYGKPDVPFIKSECSWIRSCYERKEIPEPEWYAALSIIGRFDSSGDEAHKFSQLDSRYDAHETTSKLNHALEASGPITCEFAKANFHEGCLECPFYGQVSSPIQIKSDSHIATEDCGFTTLVVSPQGGVKYERHYNDLLRHYAKTKSPVYMSTIKRFMEFNGKHYEIGSDNDPKNYAERMFRQPVKSNERAEFLDKFKSSQKVSLDFIAGEKLAMKHNMANGIYDFKTGELLPHDSGFGFMSCVDYEYDPKANECPTYERLLHNITLGRQELIDVLEEFIGYCVAGESYWLQKILILSGEGANGKSSLIKVMQKIIGTNSCGFVEIAQIAKDKFAAAELEGKLVNFSEEEDVNSFKDSKMLKRLTGDTAIQVQHKFEKPFMMLNKAKLVISYNEIPYIADLSVGFRRRLLPIPCDLDLEKNPSAKIENLHDKIEAELPAIFNRIVNAYKRFKRQGGFSEGDIIAATVKNTLEEGNKFIHWLNDWVIQDDDAFIAISEAYSHFQETCEEGLSERYRTSKDAFAKKFRKQMKAWGAVSKVRKLDGKVVRGYLGVRCLYTDEKIHQDEVRGSGVPLESTPVQETYTPDSELLDY
jgi:P4 family phage/plasmid primase-like protien